MVSKLFITCNNNDIQSLYKNAAKTNLHTFNLVFIENVTINPNQTKTIDMGIKCNMKELHKSISSVSSNLDLFVCIPYWIVPNNFLGKTTLLSVCSPIIIQPNTDETIKIVLYNYGVVPAEIKKGHQYFKILCSNLQEISKVIIQ